MEQSTLTILALYGLFGIALATLWLRHQSVLRQREQMQIRLGNLQGNLANTSNRLDLLSRGVDTILGETPEVHELLAVHKSLESAESLLFEQDVTISSSESCAIATHAARSILSNYQSDSEDKGRENILPGIIPLVLRLDAILTEAEMKSEDLELNGEEQRCLGELFHEAGKSSRAADFYRRAHTLSPEGPSVLYSLASIQRDEGDLDTLDRTLERLLAIDPDDIEVLKEQAILLFGSEDIRLNRNTRRLEALGEDFEISTDQMSLNNISGRASDVQSAINPHLKEPLTAEGWVTKSAKLFQLGEIGTALESIEKALYLDPTSSEAWLLKAKLLAAGDERTKEALQAVRRAAALGEYTVLLESEILENDGKLDSARAVLEEWLEKTPSDAEARGRLSLVLFRAGAIDWATKVLHEAPVEAWESASLHIMEGRLHLLAADEYRDRTGDHDHIILLDATISFDSAIEKDRESGLAWLGRSRALRYQGSLKEAEVALVRARRLIPEHPSISLEEAHLCLETGKLDQANALVSEASTNLQNHSSIPFIRGIIAARQGRFIEAQTFFSKVLLIQENHIRARLNRCSAALLANDLPTALDDADYLVENVPELNLARQRRSEILMNLGDWGAAEIELRTLLSNQPEHIMGLVHLGTCMIAMDKAEQAEKPLNDAIRYDPKHSDAWYQRGLLYLDFGRVEEAKSDFEAAAKHDTKHIDARLRIAAILHEGEDANAAVIAWRKVLDIDPEHRLARRRLQESSDRQKTIKVRVPPKD
ncbi:MAG: tetratricopeptide repeat protein [Candidatus Thalassarchaeaceae archaeon]|nr:tetratricopeptide repeat protein [Candidatus Thalassarchaeaceae archaeon]MDG1554322.1 tetratricopeptide repeat protein [Candidatus Thalassarchaeaceae archaeon]